MLYMKNKWVIIYPKIIFLKEVKLILQESAVNKIYTVGRSCKNHTFTQDIH